MDINAVFDHYLVYVVSEFLLSRNCVLTSVWRRNRKFAVICDIKRPAVSVTVTHIDYR